MDSLATNFLWLQVIWLGIVSTCRGLEKQKEKKKTCQITPLELREEKEKNIFLGG